MESVKNTIMEMTASFNSRMGDFQRELQNLNGNNPQSASTSPVAKLQAEFNSFQSFVVSSLQTLQNEIVFLSNQHNRWEMRSRRKMLLIHGVPEAPKENPFKLVSKVVIDHLKVTEFKEEAISRCHRLGTIKKDKTRPIAIKFKDVTMRDSIWFSKTRLKGSSYTLSEFLIKDRHNVFVAARARFGVTSCWTKDGYIIVQATDGTRHRITMMAELENIPAPPAGPLPDSAPVSPNIPKDGKVLPNMRPKRLNRVK